MSQPPGISIIIPAHDAEHTIDHCLQALAHQTMPRDQYEILVVDDGSSDGTRSRVEEYPGVRLLTQSQSGPAAARNLGARHALGQILLFTDADCEPVADWTEQMVAAFENRDVVGAKGTYLNRRPELVARFVQLEYEDKYRCMARPAGGKQAARGEVSIDFVDTYSAAYRRELFLAEGGFDSTFPVASVEDQEFSFRLAEQGYKMVFVPQAHVYHHGHPRDLRSYWRRKYRIGYWKVRLGRQHPGKLLRDSHTPQVLRLQILLAGLASACLLGGLVWRPLSWGFVASGLLFVLTTLPFAIRTWPRDPLAALFSPPLLLVRALALGTGFVAGLVAGLKPSPG
jgi:GT2 family glycosyltransferase